MSSLHIFNGHIIDAPSPDQLRIRNAYIGVENGVISFVKEDLNKNDYPTARFTELTSGQFIIPGLVDCHLHAAQYAFIATAFGKPLLEWLEATVHKYEPKCASVTYASSLYEKIVRKTLQNGTTTACYFGTIHVDATVQLAHICERRRQRAFVGKVNQDQMFPDELKEDTTVSIEETNQFIKKIQGLKYVKPVITPRFAVSCTRDLMKQLGDLAKEKDVLIQTHLSESVNECELIGSMYPECTNYTNVYDKYNLLGNNTILAHSIHLSDDELTVIKETRSSVIHCPNANLTMKSGVCQVKNLLEKKVKIGLGTDVSGGHSASMVDAMRMAMLVGNINAFEKNNCSISLSEVLYLATLGGAECLGLKESIGSFDSGKQFDALVIDCNSADSPIDVFEWNAIEDLFGRFILQGDSRNIRDVYVDGQLVDTSI
ncbi:Guanine deaminase [Entamoeba marina]